MPNGKRTSVGLSNHAFDKKKLKLCRTRHGSGVARARAMKEAAELVKNADDGNSLAHLSFIAALNEDDGLPVRKRCVEKEASSVLLEANDVDRDVYDDAEDGVVEFFDLLKVTAREDVQMIDSRLRALRCKSAVATELRDAVFLSKKTKQIYQVALSLVNVSEERVKLGMSLQRFAASESAWGKCLLAAGVAGELLRYQLNDKKEARTAIAHAPHAWMKRRSERAQHAAWEAWDAQEKADADPVDYFASRMEPDEEGDRKCQAFYNKQLKRAYISLCLQVQCSNFLAQECGSAVYELDPEVKDGTRLTEDGMARFDGAVEASQRLYPFTVAAGKIASLKLPSYYIFQQRLKLFLAVYREFFLFGEVVHEQLSDGNSLGFRVLYNDPVLGKIGYRVRGELSEHARERRYVYWAAQLGPLNMAHIRARLSESQKQRKAMELKLVQQRREFQEKKNNSPSKPRDRKMVGMTAKPKRVLELEMAPSPEVNPRQTATAKRAGYCRVSKVDVPGTTTEVAPVDVRRSRKKSVPKKTFKVTKANVVVCAAPKDRARTAGRSRGRALPKNGDADSKIVEAANEEAGAGFSPSVRDAGVRDTASSDPDGAMDEGVCMEDGLENEDVDPRQVRSADFNYTMVGQLPKVRRFFSVVMMDGDQDGGQPRTESMKAELDTVDASDRANSYVSVEAGGEFSYMDVNSLTYNLHGTHDIEKRNNCVEKAGKNGVAVVLVPPRGSFVSREVNVLHSDSVKLSALEATVDEAESIIQGALTLHSQIGPLGLDVGALVQGMYQFAFSKDCKGVTLERILSNRGNFQMSFGVADHNYSSAKEAAASVGAGVANPKLQSEGCLQNYFPDRGRFIGAVVKKLAGIRDALAAERGDVGREYNDELRNGLFSAMAAEMCGQEGLLGVENFTIGLTGSSKTLQEMVDKCLSKLSKVKRSSAELEWKKGSGVETEDHGDEQNPVQSEYSRVVLGKWRIHLERDRPYEVLVVTIIANHRSAAGVYEAKMKSIRVLDHWFEKVVRMRREKEAAAVEASGGRGGQVSFEADDVEFGAEGGSLVRIGFLPEEKVILMKNGKKIEDKGAFVSFTQAADCPGEWKPSNGLARRLGSGSGDVNGDGHDKDDEDDIDTSDNEDNEGTEMKGQSAESSEGMVSEVDMLQYFQDGILDGEVCMNRADFNRFADFSGCVAAAEKLRDRYNLTLEQSTDVALCILWHTRSRAIFLLKCGALLDLSSEWARKFKSVVDDGEDGDVGHFIMEGMVPSKFLGRVSSELTRIKLGFLNWGFSEGAERGRATSFTAEFVVEQRNLLISFLQAAEKLKPKASTRDFLNKWVNGKGNAKCKLPKFIGKFIAPTVIPICFMMCLTKVAAFRAAETPILDTKKRHHEKLVEMGVQEQFMDLSFMVVALRHGTAPCTPENTGCEVFRGQKNVHDFWLAGSLWFGLRPVAGCVYNKPEFAVHVKLPGAGQRWMLARKINNRWRHPGSVGAYSNEGVERSLFL